MVQNVKRSLKLLVIIIQLFKQLLINFVNKEDKQMKNKIAKLIDVKSLVTLILTAVFAYLAIEGKISGTEFLTIFTVIIGFYFGTQSMKNNDKKDNEQ